MHLNSLWISEFKNLKDFTINFNQQKYYDIIIGKNGSGKSNFFEAIIEIFEFLRDKSSLGYDFKIEYSINNTTHKVEFLKSKLYHNGSNKEIDFDLYNYD
jgi:recombinational DNA repair ATPase RecF